MAKSLFKFITKLILFNSMAMKRNYETYLIRYYGITQNPDTEEYFFDFG